MLERERIRTRVGSHRVHPQQRVAVHLPLSDGMALGCAYGWMVHASISIRVCHTGKFICGVLDCVLHATCGRRSSIFILCSEMWQRCLWQWQCREYAIWQKWACVLEMFLNSLHFWVLWSQSQQVIRADYQKYSSFLFSPYPSIYLYLYYVSLSRSIHTHSYHISSIWSLNYERRCCWTFSLARHTHTHIHWQMRTVIITQKCHRLCGSRRVRSVRTIETGIAAYAQQAIKDKGQPEYTKKITCFHFVDSRNKHTTKITQLDMERTHREQRTGFVRMNFPLFGICVCVCVFSSRCSARNMRGDHAWCAFPIYVSPDGLHLFGGRHSYYSPCIQILWIFQKGMEISIFFSDNPFACVMATASPSTFVHTYGFVFFIHISHVAYVLMATLSINIRVRSQYELLVNVRTKSLLLLKAEHDRRPTNRQWWPLRPSIYFFD